MDVAILKNLTRFNRPRNFTERYRLRFNGSHIFSGRLPEYFNESRFDDYGIDYTNHAPPYVEDCSPMIDILDFFHVYYIPTIILVGLIGNLLSCVVFLKTHLKLRSSSYYLAALATADFGFLATLLCVWLNNNIDLEVFNQEGWCQGLVYASSVCSFLSVWLIVAFTVERFIAVQYPLHRPHMCTVKRAKAIVLCLTIFALLVHCYSFFTAGILHTSAGKICDMKENYRETMRIINIIDSIVTLIIPLALIIVMNTMITRNLLRFGRRLQQQQQNNGGTSLTNYTEFQLNQTVHSNSSSKIRRGGSLQSFHSSNSRQGPSSASQMVQLPQAVTTRLTNATAIDTPPQTSRCIHIRSSSTNLVSTKTQQSITKMLLLISTVFVLLNLPSYVIRLYVFVCFSLWRQNVSSSLWCMQQFFMLLYYTNFSINFLLYSMCGITFRRCLWQLMRNTLKLLTRHKCNLLRNKIRS